MMTSRLPMMTSRCILLTIFIFATTEASTMWKLRTFVDEQLLEVPATRRTIFNSGNLSIVPSIGRVAVIDREQNIQHWIDYPVDNATLRACLHYFGPIDCYRKTLLVSNYDVNNWIFCGGTKSGRGCELINKQTREKTNLPMMKLAFSDFPDAIGYVTNTTGRVQAYAAMCVDLKDCRFQQQFHDHMRTKKEDNSFIQGEYSNSGKSKFVHVTSRRGMTYLFYSETHENFDKDKFTGDGTKNYYALVARVCDNDPGMTQDDKDDKLFTTFAKIRLLCPYTVSEGSEGGGVLYFDVLKSVVHIDDDVIYGLFELPGWWKVKSSAICKFSLDKLDKYFDGVEFGDGETVKGEIEFTNGGEGVRHGTEKLQPGQCPYDNKATDTRNGISRLIHRMVQPIGNRPVLVREMMTFDYMTSLTIKSTDRFHSIFLIQRDGTLEKHRIDLTRKVEPQLLIKYHFNKQFNDAPILSASYTPQGLLIATDTTVYLAAPSNCASYPNCQTCNNDTDCEWTGNYTCVPSDVIHTQLNLTFCGVKLPQHVEELNMTWRDDVMMFTWGLEHDKFGRLGLAEKFLIQISDAEDENLMIFKHEKSVNLTRDHSDSNFTISKNNEFFEAGKFYVIEIRGILGKILSEKNSERDTLRFCIPISTPANVSAKITSNFAKFHWNSPIGSDEEQISIFDSNTNQLQQNVVIKKLSDDVTSSITIGNLQQSTKYVMLMTSFSKQRVESKPAKFEFQTANRENDSNSAAECEIMKTTQLYDVTTTPTVTSPSPTTMLSPTTSAMTSSPPTSSSPTSSSPNTTATTNQSTREAEGTEISTTYSVAEGNGQVKRVTQTATGMGLVGVMLIVFIVLFITAMVVIFVNYFAFRQRRRSAMLMVEKGAGKSRGSHREGGIPSFLECCVFIPKEISSSASSSSGASSANPADDLEVAVDDPPCLDSKSDVIRFEQ